MANERLPGNEIASQPTAQEVIQAGSEFIEHFGIEASPVTSPEEFDLALKQINPRYKGERHLVRYALEADQRVWPEETQRIIMQAAESMRLLEHETPLEGHYGLVVAMGGLRHANLDRLRYAAGAMKDKQASFNRLMAAGATRPLEDSEKATVADYAPEAETELDLLEAAAKIVEQEYPGLEVEVFGIEYEQPDGKRANTPALLNALFAKLEEEGVDMPNLRVGVVTTQIFQASVSLDAARVGRTYGLEIMAAGNPSDPEIAAKRTVSSYMAEVIRTLRAASQAAQINR